MRTWNIDKTFGYEFTKTSAEWKCLSIYEFVHRTVFKICRDGVGAGDIKDFVVSEPFEEDGHKVLRATGKYVSSWLKDTPRSGWSRHDLTNRGI